METTSYLGKIGENIALRYLLKKKYKLVIRNYRTEVGELDLICINGKILVFVEVRTRLKAHNYYPEETILNSKLSRVQLCAEIFLARYNLKCRCRIDAIAIILDGNFTPVYLRHYINI